MTVLVTGATGSVGRLVVDHLLRAGAEQVRALTTNPRKAAFGPEVEVVRGYLGRPETLPAALEGVERMYLAPLEDTVREVTALARRAGVKHIVDLAGPKDGHWGVIAEAVEDSGVAWTHLEPGEFMDNFLVWAEQVRAGTVHEAYPGAASAPIEMDDVAAVAAVALLEDGHQGQGYELTGPESLTRAEMIGLIGAAIDRDVRCERVPLEEAIRHLQPAMGEYAAWYLQGQEALIEHPQRAVDTVQRLTGRPATTFVDWVAKHADDFR